ncbi:MAG: sodium-dependent transporter [Idiomarina sp.]|nr:sodium-dependent transporter [Idiomarina sp.]
MTSHSAISSRWSTRLSFMLAATGAAVGLGNIWKFPYIMGENGGAAFIVIYLLCIVALGIPIFIAELLIGRRGRHSPGYAARQLAVESKRHPAWQLTGWVTMFTGFMILTFYVVIAGWAMSYVFKSAQGMFIDANQAAITQLYRGMASSWTEMIIFTAFIVLATAIVVGNGFKQGLERTVRFAMPVMLLLLVGLAFYSSAVGDFAQAADFMFRPDFSEVTATTVLVALGHAFFTLSLASGVMMMYGAYLPASTSILSTSVWIAIADTLVALIAGLVIFPLVFAYGLTPAEGPGLIFQTLPLAFASMPLGVFIGTVFFIMLLLAAFTSAISMVESIATFVVERFDISRWAAALSTCAVLFSLSLLTVFSFAQAPWAQLDVYLFGKQLDNWFDVIEHITSNVLLPLGGLAIALFAGWAVKTQFMQAELNTSARAFKVWQFLVRFVAPVAITLVFLQLTGMLRL